MYHCLLILTDGNVNDFRKTVDLIVELTNQPLSIIIVGIGNADFTALETLDADEFDLVDSNNETAKRDIVQFVALRDFQYEENGETITEIDKLAEAVLAEVPDQLVGFMQSRNISPGQVPKDLNSDPEEEKKDDDDDD